MSNYWYVDELEEYEYPPPTPIGPDEVTPNIPIDPTPIKSTGRWPLGKVYFREPGFPGGTFSGITFEYLAPMECVDIGYTAPPPNFMPGDPIPANMPPAWGGPDDLSSQSPGGALPDPVTGEYPGGRRPPFPWEKWMPNPVWNPRCGGMPSVVENPGYDPNAIRPGNAPSIPRPGPGKLKPPTVPVPPNSVEIPVPAMRPPGLLPAVGGAVRIVMGVGPIVLMLADMLDPNVQAYNVQKICMKLVLTTYGYDDAAATTVIGLLELYRQDPVELQSQINSMVSWIRDNGPPLSSMVWPDRLACREFASNIFIAVKLARCKLNPPSTDTLASRKQSLIDYLDQCLSDELVMHNEMMTWQTKFMANADYFCDVNGGHYSQFCCGQYQGWLQNVFDIFNSRMTYINNMVELLKCLGMLDIPTCENGMNAAAVDDYLEKVNTEVSAVGLVQLNKKAEWTAMKATFANTNPECQSGIDD